MYIFRCSRSREVSDLFHSFAKSSALINWNSELCIYVYYTVQISYFNTTLRLGCVLCIEDKKKMHVAKAFVLYRHCYMNRELKFCNSSFANLYALINA